MRNADSRLPGARRVALLLFCCSVVLPTVVVLRRGGGAYFSSSDGSDGALDDSALDLGTPRPQRAAVQQRRAAMAPGVQGTRVLVYVTREQGSAVELHVRKDAAGMGDVCSGTTQADEAYAATAERVLWECASLRPPPDVEFLERAGEEPAPGEPVPFVALVRTARLLRGDSKAPQVRALLVRPARVVSRCRSQDLAFTPLQQVVDDVAAGIAFAPGVSETLPAAQAYLAPWVATAGKKAGACGPPPAGTAVS